MRYEDWTFCEAEVRLAEHGEFRRALELRSLPDYTILYRFLHRWDQAAFSAALNEVACRIPLPVPCCCTQVAVDGTGVSPGAISKKLGTPMVHAPKCAAIFLAASIAGARWSKLSFPHPIAGVESQHGTKLLRPNQYCRQSAPGQAAGVALRRLCLNKLAKPASSLEHLTAPTTGRRLTAYYLYPSLID
jgi:hypothetical protein